jgi:hypothetical protein
VGRVQSPGMRTLFALGSLIVLTACSGDPAKYGITGPGTQAVPAPVQAAETPDAQPVPGVSTVGSKFGPSPAPSTGSSGFWGYN